MSPHFVYNVTCKAVRAKNMRTITFFFIILLGACDLISNSADVTGSWKSDDEVGTMIFHKNGNFDLLNQDGTSMLDKSSGGNATWLTITEVTPYQLYVKIETVDKSEKIPLGIYKISKGKLIIRQPKTFHNTIGGVSLGISRYEMPTDFSGVLSVYTRI